jgi:hypothetical protein
MRQPWMLAVDDDGTYFALMQSNIVLAGFPTLTGALSKANRKGALSAPEPGKRPSAVGNVLSSLVAMKRQSGLRVRYWNALDSFV